MIRVYTGGAATPDILRGGMGSANALQGGSRKRKACAKVPKLEATVHSGNCEQCGMGGWSPGKMKREAGARLCMTCA